MTDSQNQNIPSAAVVGSGYGGKNLIRNYYQIGALKLICDKNECLLENFRKKYPGVQTCLALNDVLAMMPTQGYAAQHEQPVSKPAAPATEKMDAFAFEEDLLKRQDSTTAARIDYKGIPN